MSNVSMLNMGPIMKCIHVVGSSALECSLKFEADTPSCVSTFICQRT